MTEAVRSGNPKQTQQILIDTNTRQQLLLDVFS